MMRGVGFNDCNYVVDVVVDYDRMVLIRSYRVGIGGSVISVAPVSGITCLCRPLKQKL